MYQPNLPHFDEEYAKVCKKDINFLNTIGRLAKFYVNMNKHNDLKVIPLRRKQKKILQYYFTFAHRNIKERN